LISLLFIAGGGVALFAIENSGERGTGALLALGGTIAFGAVMALLFAKDGTFGGASGRAVAIATAIVGALPVAAISFAAIRFAGFPIGSRTPAVDWSALSAGVVLASVRLRSWLSEFEGRRSSQLTRRWYRNSAPRQRCR
jgi:hypothetical protein